jgi:hypothetical protein
VISDTELGDICADFRNDPRDLVAKHGGCREYRVTGEEHVSVAQPGGPYVDQNFAAYWPSDVHVLEIEWTADCVYDKRFHVRPPYVRADLTFQSGRDKNHRLTLWLLQGWPLFPNRFGLWFLLSVFHFPESNLTESVQYVQDIFTIRPIAIKYQNGIAASEIFPCGLAKSSIMGAPHAGCVWLSPRFPARFRI